MKRRVTALAVLADRSISRTLRLRPEDWGGEMGTPEKLDLQIEVPAHSIAAGALK